MAPAVIRVLAVALLALTACDPVARPQRHLPEQFYETRLLGGEQLTREKMAGHPWVINLWVPG